VLVVRATVRSCRNRGPQSWGRPCRAANSSSLAIFAACSISRFRSIPFSVWPCVLRLPGPALTTHPAPARGQRGCLDEIQPAIRRERRDRCLAVPAKRRLVMSSITPTKPQMLPSSAWSGRERQWIQLILPSGSRTRVSSSGSSPSSLRPPRLSLLVPFRRGEWLASSLVLKFLQLRAR
jgi:hypothetical protein